MTWHAGTPLVLPPAGFAKSFVLRGVATLSLVDQARLLAWLRQSKADTQMVTETALPLLPLVHRGAFLDALYYNLNVIFLKVTA